MPLGDPFVGLEGDPRTGQGLHYMPGARYNPYLIDIIHSSHVLQKHVYGEQALADEQCVSEAMKMQPSLKAWRKTMQQGESLAASLDESKSDKTAKRVCPSRKPRWVTHEPWLRLGRHFSAWDAHENAVEAAADEDGDDPGAPPPGPLIQIASLLDFMCVIECMLPPGTLAWPLPWCKANKVGKAQMETPARQAEPEEHPAQEDDEPQEEQQEDVQCAGKREEDVATKRKGERKEEFVEELQAAKLAAEVANRLADEHGTAQVVLEPEDGDVDMPQAAELAP